MGNKKMTVELIVFWEFQGNDYYKLLMPRPTGDLCIVLAQIRAVGDWGEIDDRAWIANIVGVKDCEIANDINSAKEWVEKYFKIKKD